MPLQDIKMIKKIVLGVPIADVAKQEALELVSSWIDAKETSCRVIATVGPEFVLTAQTDTQFRSILGQTDLNLPDGIGLYLTGITQRITGLDFMLELCSKASHQNWTIGLLGGQDGVGEKTRKVLLAQFPGLKFSFVQDGGEADETIRHVNSNKPLIVHGRNTKNENYKLRTMNAVPTCDLLFVALGHPKQEKFLFAVKKKILNSQFSILNFKVGMGVGGAFDEISGKIPRTPVWLSALGLKWLFRVIVEPRQTKIVRIKRMFNAVVVFPWMVVRERFGK